MPSSQPPPDRRSNLAPRSQNTRYYQPIVQTESPLPRHRPANLNLRPDDTGVNSDRGPVTARMSINQGLQPPTPRTARVNLPNVGLHGGQRRPSTDPQTTRNQHALNAQSEQRRPSDITIRLEDRMDVDAKSIKSESSKSKSPPIKPDPDADELQDNGRDRDSPPIKQERKDSEDGNDRNARRRNGRAPSRTPDFRPIKIERNSQPPEIDHAMDYEEIEIPIEQERTFVVRVQLEYRAHHGPFHQGVIYHHAPYRCSWISGGSEVFRLTSNHGSLDELLAQVNHLAYETLRAMKSVADRDFNLGLLQRHRVNALRVMWDYRIDRPVEAFQPSFPAGGGGTEVTERNWRDVLELVGKREGKDVLLLKHVKNQEAGEQEQP